MHWAAIVFLLELIVKTILEIFKRIFYKLPIMAAYAAGFLIILGIFTAAISTLMNSFIIPAMPDSVSMAFSWFLPDNTAICMTTIYTAKMIRFIYDQQFALLQLKASASA